MSIQNVSLFDVITSHLIWLNWNYLRFFFKLMYPSSAAIRLGLLSSMYRTWKIIKQDRSNSVHINSLSLLYSVICPLCYSSSSSYRITLLFGVECLNFVAFKAVSCVLLVIYLRFDLPLVAQWISKMVVGHHIMYAIRTLATHLDWGQFVKRYIDIK